MIWGRGGRRGVGRGERIIKCHQFDTTWGGDAILVLESHVAAGQVDVCGLLTGILILTIPAGRFFLKKRRNKRKRKSSRRKMGMRERGERNRKRGILFTF